MRKVWALFAVVPLAGCMGWMPGQQAYWDAQVKELCEKDGGVTVYERVKLTQSEYELLGGIYGAISVPSRNVAASSTPYVSDTTITALHDWAPEVWRRETLIVRVADEKVLAKQITYGRRGGDVPVFFIGHPSFYGCSELGIRLDVEKQTFEVLGSDQ